MQSGSGDKPTGVAKISRNNALTAA